MAIVTLGCPKNEVDSEGMAAILEGRFRLADGPAEADVVVVNTCGFIAAAREESLEELRKLAAAKRPGQWLIAAGCLAEMNPASLRAEVPGIDALLGTRRWHEIGDLLEGLAHGSGETNIREAPTVVGAAVPEWIGGSVLVETPIQRRPPGATAYVKIADGCDASCAFCTIPSIKGPFRSRQPRELMAEVAGLAESGCKEVVLVAQDTTLYGRDLGLAAGLPDLLCSLARAAPSLPWLRLMYTYPQHISDRLIEAMAGTPQVCHYLDMPLQHAHPDTLRRMRRPADPEAVLRLLERVRAAMPDVALRTAFIVGFPGESEAEFEALLQFVRQVRFDHAGAFVFSREEGTPAYAMEPQVPEGLKEERHSRLLDVQQEVSLGVNRSLVGKEFDVLVEGIGDGISVGRTFRNAPEIDGLAIVQAEAPAGELVRARVTEAMAYDLLMEPVTRGLQARSPRNRAPLARGPGSHRQRRRRQGR